MGKALYNNRRWRRLRLQFLAENPLCIYCEKRNLIKQAEHVDHIIPHKGDYSLFWDLRNLQGLCVDCHVSLKSQIENGKRVCYFDDEGWEHEL